MTLYDILGVPPLHPKKILNERTFKKPYCIIRIVMWILVKQKSTQTNFKKYHTLTQLCLIRTNENCMMRKDNLLHKQAQLIQCKYFVSFVSPLTPI